MSNAPLVSVVTPVYNGGSFIAECIESVLAQSHRNLEHILLDNASTDDTPRILADYAARDPRVRIRRNSSTLWFLDNWNRSLELISADSSYCRILHADDTMYPDAIEAAVAVAESAPSVGIVGALRLRGEQVECTGLVASQSVFSGWDVVRRFMKGEVYALAPSSMLVRTALVRARQPFYPRAYLHADLAACYDILSDHDYGFVHRVLSFSRKHPGSITSTVAERKQTLLREGLLMLQQYGPRYFSLEERAALERVMLKRYYRILVRGFCSGRGRDFLAYHLEGLRLANRLPSMLDVALAATAELGASLASPGKAIRHLRARPRH